MQKDTVLEILKTVKYPGFSRDIVSFGMVEDIIIEGKAIKVQLKVSSQQEEKKATIKQEVEKAIAGMNAFSAITIELLEGAPAANVQAEPQKTPSIAHGNVKYIIAVASGKGGVGKSTVAANLALALKQQGHSVGLLDLDIYGPSLPIILGINKSPIITKDRKLIPLDHMGMKVMSFGFISGNETPVIWRGPMVARMTEQFFADVIWGDLDYLILDLPPGTGDVQLTLTQKVQITGAIMVTTPQDLALADVRKGADMFKKVNAPVIGVVENMSGLIIEGQVDATDGVKSLVINKEKVSVDTEGKFAMKLNVFKHGGGKKESTRLDVPLLEEIPLMPEVMLATDAGIPIVESDPDSFAAKIYLSLATKINEAVSS
ncbi:MAG: Mrp/NBP35 family ATP-binding protein [Candidatus Marinimicrobia bacterium]|nr:Mrp/NBP35 family ATP-binding protein [Candidatus Neomarinimicrobiota bacterium]